jgi:phospholipid/cholesterol/gamma-HCH transport system substrate-binding protein
LSQSLQQVSNRVNQQGIGGTLGPPKLPDYKPGKRK